MAGGATACRRRDATVLSTPPQPLFLDAPDSLGAGDATRSPWGAAAAAAADTTLCAGAFAHSVWRVGQNALTGRRAFV